MKKFPFDQMFIHTFHFMINLYLHNFKYILSTSINSTWQRSMRPFLCVENSDTMQKDGEQTMDEQKLTL
jgi:hypothetical protein